MITNPLADEKVDEETKTLAENASLPPVGPDSDLGDHSVPNPWVLKLRNYRPQQAGILDIWRELYGDKRRYVYGLGWFIWNDTYWQQDKLFGVESEMQSLVGSLNFAADALEPGEKGSKEAWQKKEWLKATKLSRNLVGSLIELAKHESAVSPDSVNAGNVLNLKNGVFDLDTYKLREHTPDDMFTYVLPYKYDSSARCPRWMQFLNEVLVDDQGQTDKDLMRLFSQAVGHTLTNDVLEKMFFLFGSGANGKSVAVAVVRALVGDLSVSVDFQRLGDSGNYDIPTLVGKRMAVSTESEKGKKFKEAFLKSVVSGEQIKGRQIRQENIEFKPVCKVWWAMNDLPWVNDTSDSVWRRLVTIPFKRTFVENERDPNLTGKLESELSGIFNWAIDGLKDLRRDNRFAKSKAAEDTKEQYRVDQNPIAQWLDEEVIISDQGKTFTRDAYKAFMSWSSTTNSTKPSEKTFSRELARQVRKHETRTSNGFWFYMALKTSEDPDNKRVYERLAAEAESQRLVEVQQDEDEPLYL